MLSQKAVCYAVCMLKASALFPTRPKARASLPYSFHDFRPQSQWNIVVVVLTILANQTSTRPVVIHQILNFFQIGFALRRELFGFEIVDTFVIEMQTIGQIGWEKV